jgi:virginiamycin A acetyltransferase
MRSICGTPLILYGFGEWGGEMATNVKPREGKQVFFGDFLCWVYPRVPNFFKRSIRTILYFTEGQQFYSCSLRKIFKENYGVEIGMYTHGSCFEVYGMDRNTAIGRYSSIAAGVRGLTHNHPLKLPSTHGFFFNDTLGIVKNYGVRHSRLNIGNDVWIGHNAIILPSVTEIGDGAVIGAGSVLNKNVPPYAIMFGNPAKFIGYRFPPETIEKLLASKWWEKPINEIDVEYFSRPLEDENTVI